MSGSEDKYSRDADAVVARVAGDFITELRVSGGHALEQERFDGIVDWIVARVTVCDDATSEAACQRTDRPPRD